MKLLIYIFIASQLALACGGSAGKRKGGTINTNNFDISGLPDDLTITTAGGTVPTRYLPDQYYQVRNTEGPIFEFKLVGSIDMTGLVADRTDTLSIAKLQSTEGIEGPITLFVPCQNDTKIIYICPDAESDTDVINTCANGLALSPALLEAEEFTFLNGATRDDDVDCELQAELSTKGMGSYAEYIAPDVDYTDTTFEEVVADDGTIDAGHTITMSAHRFAFAGGDLVQGIHYTITGSTIPAGLTPHIALTSTTTADFTLDGVATDPTAASNVASFTLTFLPAAFWGSVEPSNLSQVSNYSITFLN